LPRKNNLIVLGQTKRSKEREYYLRLAIAEHWNKRAGATDESQSVRTEYPHAPKISPPVREINPEAATVFKDSYMLEFFGAADDP
jgi:hypothetical protein